MSPRMLKWFVRFVAFCALLVSQTTRVNRVLERAGLNLLFRRSCRVRDYSMADIAVVSDALAVIAHVLAVMTTESERLGPAGTIVAQKTEALRKR